MFNTAVLTKARKTNGVAPHRAWLSTELAPLYPHKPGWVVLVAEFVRLHGSTAGAARALNKARGTGYRKEDVAKWRRNDARAPRAVQEVMRREVLASRFGPTLLKSFERLLDLRAPRDYGVALGAEESDHPGHELV